MQDKFGSFGWPLPSLTKISQSPQLAAQASSLS